MNVSLLAIPARSCKDTILFPFPLHPSKVDLDTDVLPLRLYEPRSIHEIAALRLAASQDNRSCTNTPGVSRSRYGEFVRPFMVEAGPQKIDTTCLPEGLHGKYKLAPAKMSLQKKLKDSVGSFSAHNNMMLDFFKSTLKLGQSVTERPKSPREPIQALAEDTLGSPSANLATAKRGTVRGSPLHRGAASVSQTSDRPPPSRAGSQRPPLPTPPARPQASTRAP